EDDHGHINGPTPVELNARRRTIRGARRRTSLFPDLHALESDASWSPKTTIKKTRPTYPNLRSDPTNFRQECFSFSRTPVTLVTPGSAGLVGASMMPALGSGLRPIEARNCSRRMVFNFKYSQKPCRRHTGNSDRRSGKVRTRGEEPAAQSLRTT